MRAALRAYGRWSNPAPDKIATTIPQPVERGISFRDLARMAWPHKTEIHLAAILHCDVRTAKRWLADDSEPPADAAMVVINEITRLYLTRPR